jgi:hypothetical protein
MALRKKTAEKSMVNGHSAASSNQMPFQADQSKVLIRILRNPTMPWFP